MYAAREIQLRKNVPQDQRSQATDILRGYYAHMAAVDDCLDRLLQTLGIKHLAVFLAAETEDAPAFRLKKAMGPNPRLSTSSFDELDLSFLQWSLPEP